MTRKECLTAIRDAATLYKDRGLPTQDFLNEVMDTLIEFEKSVIERNEQ